MMVMSHQYVLTEQVGEVEAWSKDHGGKLPLLRDVDVSYYLRQEKNGFNIGPYEPNCKGHWMTPDDPMPDDFSFQLYPDDLDRIEDIVADAMERVPLAGSAGIERIINGPIPYAPDGLPLIGPMPGVKNAFEACVFTFGIAQAGGCREGAGRVGDRRRRPSGICGASIPAASPITPIRRIATPRGWRFTATNTPCTSPGTNGPPDGTRSFRRCTTGWRRQARFSAPTTDGNGRTGSPNRATTPLKRRHRPGAASGPWEPRIREECEAVRDNCRHPGDHRLYAAEGRRAGSAGLDRRADRLAPAGRGADRAGLFRRRSRADRDRDVLHGAWTGGGGSDHGGCGAMA